MKHFIFILFIFICFSCDGFRLKSGILDGDKIIDHNDISVDFIPAGYINTAKDSLRIGYWHTSHGSQLTTGMAGLDAFKGGTGLYAVSNDGTPGTLHLQEPASMDLGDDWVTITRTFLDAAGNEDVNVIIWSWCGQVSDASEVYIQAYLDDMNALELEYPNVMFVYMTGHSDGSGLTGNLHLRNQQIREYCTANNKWLYDFYDIECYDPDGIYFGDRDVSDGCTYTFGAGTGNWAQEWQDAHAGEWYNCSSAHSLPLNANLKAYAAWNLWVSLAMSN